MVKDAAGIQVQVGDVVQIDPLYDDRFAACMMVVTELKPAWNGLVGYVRVPGEGDAYYRVEGRYFVRVGPAEWTHGQHDEAQDAATGTDCTTEQTQKS
jgi:hypothetical protein